MARIVVAWSHQAQRGRCGCRSYHRKWVVALGMRAQQSFRLQHVLECVNCNATWTVRP